MNLRKVPGALLAGLAACAALEAQEARPSPATPQENKPEAALPVPSDKSGRSFYPMPAFASDKDSGLTYGILAALMWTDPEGIQDTLLSASLDYQHLVKWSGEVELRYYPTLTSVLDVDGYLAERVEYSMRLFYENFRLDDVYHARFDAWFQRSATDRFFGVGGSTLRSAESVRTSNDDRTEVRFGPHLTESWDLEGTLRWRQFRVGDSLITDFPQMRMLYPTQPGIEGGELLAAGIRTVYDTRDSMTTPTSGVFATAYVEHAYDFAQGQSHPFWICGASATSLWPLDSDSQFVTVVNLATQEAIGSYIPFWELPALGGPTTLRSFNGGRFVDKGMILLNVEERIRIAQASLFDVSGEVQVAPFFDLGKVFDSLDDLTGKGVFQNFHYSYGVGFRGIVKPSFVGRLDIGLGGREGVGVTIGLDYPF